MDPEIGARTIAFSRLDFAAAKARYQNAVKAKPGWKPPESRLKALVATGKVPG